MIVHLHDHRLYPCACCFTTKRQRQEALRVPKDIVQFSSYSVGALFKRTVTGKSGPSPQFRLHLRMSTLFIARGEIMVPEVRRLVRMSEVATGIRGHRAAHHHYMST